MNDQDLLFYDIEVFSHNALVVFKDINKRLVRVFHNNFVKLADFIKGKTLVSFNGYFYDDKILTYMLEQKSVYQIKQLNDRLISGEKWNHVSPLIKSLDTFQQIDVSMPSLKKIEGNWGRAIIESAVPFDIDRPLTEDEYHEVLDYCIYDVDTTIDVYKKRVESYFQPKRSLVEMLGKENAAKWNTTTLSANLLLKKPLPKWSNIRVPEEMLEIVPPEVADLWLTKNKGSVTLHDFDNEIVFGFGGAHATNTKKNYFENVHNLDVASLYPAIIINFNMLGQATPKFREIRDERIRIKHTEPVRQEGLKLILNSVSGLLRSEYSLLYNPKAAITMCAIGQIILYDLAKRLSATCEIVQINTDGVAFIPHTDDYKRIWKEWETEYDYTLEEEIFTKLWQRDVNNYIAIKANGKLKVKGGDVNRYEKDALFKNNNARILDIALVDKLVHGKDVLETLMENLDKPHLYQYILKAGGTYRGTFDEKGQEYNKVNRVFASKKEGFCLYKKRYDDGLVRFADAPLNMYLWNGECSEIENFEKIVDLNHYYQIVLKKLERWV
jgi:hypothetical protein